MRSTSTDSRLAQERRPSDGFDLAEGQASWDRAQAVQAQEQYEKPREVSDQLKRFMTDHSAVLVVLFFIILICETLHDDSFEDRSEQRGNFLPYLVEFCSAWGTVGLSMTSTAASLSGSWTAGGKLALMAVMFLGRLRGLPDAIDPSVRLTVAPPDESVSEPRPSLFGGFSAWRSTWGAAEPKASVAGTVSGAPTASASEGSDGFHSVTSSALATTSNVAQRGPLTSIVEDAAEQRGPLTSIGEDVSAIA